MFHNKIIDVHLPQHPNSNQCKKQNKSYIIKYYATMVVQNLFLNMAKINYSKKFPSGLKNTIQKTKNG